MTGQRLTDAQLARALRQHLPTAAQDGLRGRILEGVESTRQDRPLPVLFAALSDPDPVARRRLLLLVAAALLALGLAVGAVVGALLERKEPLPDLSLERPSDLAAFARSTYDSMPQVPPMTISTLQDETVKGRILVDGSGAIRIETFASADATEPETYQIYAGTSMGHLTIIDGKPVWYQQDQAIGEDPRVFILATMGSARSGFSPGCEVGVSPGEVYAYTPGHSWTWLGAEYVAGRPTHHLSCSGSDMWIDAETRVTLRSRGAELDDHFQPIPGRFRTIEATKVEFGEPPAELFEIKQPAGIAAVDYDTYDCSRSPYCSASPRPVITPPPAPADVEPPADATAIVAAASAALEKLPALDVAIEQWGSKYPGGQVRVLHDGSGRYRMETTNEGSPDPPSITLAGPDYAYSTEVQADGSVIWRSSTRRRGVDIYPLRPPTTCDIGLERVGVDMILSRPADHMTCRGSEFAQEFWVDRLTHLVVRTQEFDTRMGTTVSEIVDIQFVKRPAAMFEPPPGTELK